MRLNGASGTSDMAGKAARVCGRAHREAAEIQRVHRRRTIMLRLLWSDKRSQLSAEMFLANLNVMMIRS